MCDRCGEEAASSSDDDAALSSSLSHVSSSTESTELPENKQLQTSDRTSSVLGSVVKRLSAFNNSFTFIRKATDESNLSGGSLAPPRAAAQVVDGKDIWPEHWGINAAQLQELLDGLRQNPGWHPSNTVYTLVHDYLMPRTQGTGLGYALLQNRESPREVNLMISHAWGENAEEFLETLIRTAGEGDNMFICAFSLYQAGDGAGPTIEQQLGIDARESPFQRVLEHIRMRGRAQGWRWRWRRTLLNLPMIFAGCSALLFLMPTLVWRCAPTFGMCMVPDWQAMSWRGEERRDIIDVLMWFFASMALLCRLIFRESTIYSGRMVVVPNREVDIYSRLWCVYEIFVAKRLRVPLEVAHTLARAGKVSTRDATCSSEEDTRRILSEIEAETTFEQIDKTVFVTAHGNWWRVVELSMAVGTVITTCNLVMNRLMVFTRSNIWWAIFLHKVHLTTGPGSLFFAMSVLLVKNISWLAMFSVFARSQGAPAPKQVCWRSLSMIAGGVPFAVLGSWMLQEDFQFQIGRSTLMFGTTLIGYGLFLLTMVGLAVHLPRTLRLLGSFAAMNVLSLAMLVGICVVEYRDNQELNVEDRFIIWRVLVSGIMGTFGTCWLPGFVIRHAATRWGVRIGTHLKQPQGSAHEGLYRSSSILSSV